MNKVVLGRTRKPRNQSMRASISESLFALYSTAHAATTASNSDRSCLTWRVLRGSEIETNTSVSGTTPIVYMGTLKDEKTARNQVL